jgi:hypothetical protein
MTTIEVAERWRAFQELMSAMDIEDVRELRRHLQYIEKWLLRELERSKRNENL